MRRQLFVAGLVLIAARAASGQASTPRVWTIEATPVFAVGAESADTLDTFGQLRGVARTLAGDIVVADQHNYALRYFGPTGKFVRAVGRRGDGPGEFQMILRMLHCGDSLYVNEFSSDKWSVFSATGKYKRTFNMAAMRATAAGASRSMNVATPYDVRCNGGGVFIGEGWESGGDAKPGVFRPLVPYWLSNSLGAISAPLGSFGGSERWGQTDADGNLRGTAPLPLGKEPVIAVGRTHAYLGTADSFDIMVFGLDGKRTGTIHKSLPLVHTTPADIRRYIAVDTAGLSPPLLKAFMRLFEQVKWPETLPAYAVDHLRVKWY